jgi:hypothetical protein
MHYVIRFPPRKQDDLTIIYSPLQIASNLRMTRLIVVPALLTIAIQLGFILRMFTNVNSWERGAGSGELVGSGFWDASSRFFYPSIETHSRAVIGYKAQSFVEILLVSGSEIDSFDSVHTRMAEYCFY